MPTSADSSEQILLAPLRDVLFSRSSAPPHLPVTLEIVTPPFACAGTGSLRVVRCTTAVDAIELVAAYEGYVAL